MTSWLMCRTSSGLAVRQEAASPAQLLATGQLDPGAAAERGRELLLRGLDLQPVGVADRPDPPFRQQLDEACPGLGVGRGLGKAQQPSPGRLAFAGTGPAGPAAGQRPAGLRGAGLAGPDDPGGPGLR